ncbi:TrmB family transcriptional regulator [Candidatus Woesearchaeota archaeon]|jgi:sugar-specific transcriptional regulator TrmB|nr:TrmB family transcriptional regulator [Candidatus Woesearchaeota archaeon]MBT4835005.1 TrmB family transcriptional regulator [Candidatus Woesearchaeota archaeon]MBT6735172.1 TrmB family transcriptional regulator [Candidatus Woesearchaeota archaeon]MBT7170112.1 TrmB family transcriptional regulator [Candidatus Woesearchaeota archaeon]MBT7474961.1 TrmB family transcriptional regulator [Candidatus Woesearchaeota archaeon]
MIVKDEFLTKLRQFFGLNLYEVRIWTALLSRGKSTAGELSEIGEVPRSRAYDVLESLEKKGFVTLKVGKPIEYLAVEPKEVVERLKKSVKVDADKNLQKLKDLHNNDVLAELNTLFSQGIEYIEPADLSGAIKGRHNIYDHLETMIKRANSSVTIMTTSKGVLRKVEALRPTISRLSRKGVKVRIAAPMDGIEDEQVKDIKKFAKLKGVDNLNARFCIVDGKEVMFMVMDDKDVHPTYDLGIWVDAPYFAGAMDNLFGLVWDKS